MTKVAIHDETCSIFFDQKSHKKCDNKSAKKRGQKIGHKHVGENKSDKNRIKESDKKNRT